MNYLKNYSDNRESTYMHKENKVLENKVLENKETTLQKQIKLYPALFHKYILGIRNPNDNMIDSKYFIVYETPIIKKNICHIHCFYLKFLESMFSKYISVINKTFDIIVTYTHSEENILKKYKNIITFLNVDNYGMDIGPKFIIYEYLRVKNIQYNYIFYIHSKSNDNRRNEYLMPYINNLKRIHTQLNENNYSCYFHNILWNEFGNNNELYINDILDYLEIKQKKYQEFIEGNYYILHKNIIDKLFSDKLLYNILNIKNSFDYNWVNLYYKIPNMTNIYDNIHYSFYKYKTNKLYGNNIFTNKGHEGLADAMIEHVFERLPLIMCKEYDVRVNLLDSNHMTTYTMPINTLCIVACHTSSDLKINSLIQNKEYFEEIADDIIYINSSEFKSANVIDDMIYIENDNTLCYGKYLHVLQNIDINEYDNIILTNDSYLITKSLLAFESLFNNSTEMSALCCSNEGNKYYPDFLRRYNKTGINKIIKYYKTNLSNSPNLIQDIETKSHLIHDNSINFLYDAIDNYHLNIRFDNIKLKELKIILL